MGGSKAEVVEGVEGLHIGPKQTTDVSNICKFINFSAFNNYFSIILHAYNISFACRRV